LFTINHIKLETINSTNDYTLSLKDSLVFKEGLVVTANFQSGGNGQRGKAWESNANENLLLSVVIEPKLKLDEQSLISKIAALSVCDLLKSLGIEAEIKWPNDILVNKQKIAGILMQNKLKGDLITHTVIGIGLNINQIHFQEYLPKATSLQLVLNKELDIAKIQMQLLQFLSGRVKRFRDGLTHEKEYHAALFLKDKVAAFEISNQKFMGIIKEVSQSGKLLIQLEDDSIAAFNNQEVKFLF
jgi:BirA family biotin operon repressor/biotin-[acetyl-CoA-carboxylase] ligase